MYPMPLMPLMPRKQLMLVMPRMPDMPRMHSPHAAHAVYSTHAWHAMHATHACHACYICRGCCAQQALALCTKEERFAYRGNSAAEPPMGFGVVLAIVSHCALTELSLHGADERIVNDGVRPHSTHAMHTRTRARARERAHVCTGNIDLLANTLNLRLRYARPFGLRVRIEASAFLF